jgi:Mg2+ and Co2+ transporter CorA
MFPVAVAKSIRALTTSIKELTFNSNYRCSQFHHFWATHTTTATNTTRYLSSLTEISPLATTDSNIFQIASVQYNGKLSLNSMDTSGLLRRASIYARDLMTLNLTSRQEKGSHPSRRRRPSVSAIVPRNKLIVVSFGNVRAVAGLTEVLLLDAHNPIVQDFAKELSAIYLSGRHLEDPRELVFLELVLRDTIDSFHRRLRLYEPIVDNFLEQVANEVYSDTGVHQLVPLKDSLQSFEMQVKQCLDCLTDILEDDEQMLGLLLTEQAEATKAGTQIDFKRHEHVELLLGVYARQISNLQMEVTYLLGRLQSKQEFVALALAGYRNRMIRLNVHLAIASLSLGFCTTIAGFYGMNLVNGWEDSETAFMFVIMYSCLIASGVGIGALSYLSGSKMRTRVSQRLDENETLTGALSDMSALDYTMKHVEGGAMLDLERFQGLLKKARQTQSVSEKEARLLFDIFESNKDGIICTNDSAVASFVNKKNKAPEIQLPSKKE